MKVRVFILASSIFLSFAHLMGNANGVALRKSSIQKLCQSDLSWMQGVLQFHTDTVYVAPKDDQAIPISNFESVGIQIVQTIDEIDEPLPSVIYLHPEVVESADNRILADFYHQGIILAAINTPVSELIKEPNFIHRDWLPLHKTRPKVITFAVIHERKNGNSGYYDFMSCHNLPFVVSQIDYWICFDQSSNVSADKCWN